MGDNGWYCRDCGQRIPFLPYLVSGSEKYDVITLCKNCYYARVMANKIHINRTSQTDKGLRL